MLSSRYSREWGGPALLRQITGVVTLLVSVPQVPHVVVNADLGGVIAPYRERFEIPEALLDLHPPLIQRHHIHRERQIGDQVPGRLVGRLPGGLPFVGQDPFRRDAARSRLAVLAVPSGRAVSLSLAGPHLSTSVRYLTVP